MMKRESSNPRFPVYIISKGRWDSRLTVKCLETIHVPYHIVVEEQEREQYAAVIDPKKILILDPEYQRSFESCDPYGDNLGLRLGPGPVRNFVWDHANARGAAWHWVMDDNISQFIRFNKNLKYRVSDGTIFYAMEEFCLRYQNIAMAGPAYEFFVPRRKVFPPLVFNTRIYSCQFVRGDVPFRWRSRYNDDTDLSLRMLKAGWCTVEFNAFLQAKAGTMTVKGGNTPIYQKGSDFDGRYQMALSLVRQHPDVAHMTRKYGRWQHHVNYNRFRKNKLILKPDVRMEKSTNDFGMRVIQAADL